MTDPAFPEGTMACQNNQRCQAYNERELLTDYRMPPCTQKLVPTQLSNRPKFSEYNDVQNATPQLSVVDSERFSNRCCGYSLELMRPYHLWDVVLDHVTCHT